MDDEKILARGGNEEDIKSYARANGADLTIDDFPLEKLKREILAEYEKKFPCLKYHEVGVEPYYPAKYQSRLEWILRSLDRYAESVIAHISSNQGWEESEDFYRKQIGLEPKYKTPDPSQITTPPSVDLRNEVKKR